MESGHAPRLAVASARCPLGPLFFMERKGVSCQGTWHAPPEMAFGLTCNLKTTTDETIDDDHGALFDDCDCHGPERSGVEHHGGRSARRRVPDQGANHGNPCRSRREAAVQYHVGSFHCG